MADIKTIVNVSITRGSKQVPQEAFNVPCIFGPSNRFTNSDLIRYYEDINDMVSDGFLTSDPEYIHAAAIFSQQNPPDQVGVAKYTQATEQVDSFTVGTLVATGHAYTITINGTAVTYTSNGDSQPGILTGLLAAITTDFPTNAPVTGVVSGSGSSATLTLTAVDAGTGVSYTAVDSNLTHASTTTNHSIVNDIQAVQAVDDTWYACLVTSKNPNDILEVATYIETQQKIFITASNDGGMLSGSSTTDIASQLKARSFTRTAILYHADPTTAPDAAWVGVMIATTPGTGNWKFKTLAGQVADSLSSTQTNSVTAKSGNVYVTIGGLDITSQGVAASGDYIDVIIFIDWLMSTMEVNVYQVLVDNNKVPFTDAGIAQIESPVRATLQLGQRNQGLAPGWTVTVPAIVDVLPADKASRTLRNVSFQATLAGAINEVIINGNVSV